jgi:hypothetical protein
MKVYLVTTGEYSSFRVEAVFSTKERAERFALVEAFNREIEEFEVDLPELHKFPIWEIEIAEDGVVTSVGRREHPSVKNYTDEDNISLESHFSVVQSYQDGRPKRLGAVSLTTCVEIETEEGAIKVANERRAQVMANLGRWPKVNELGYPAGIYFNWGKWDWIERLKESNFIECLTCGQKFPPGPYRHLCPVKGAM